MRFCPSAIPLIRHWKFHASWIISATLFSAPSVAQTSFISKNVTIRHDDPHVKLVNAWSEPIPSTLTVGQSYILGTTTKADETRAVISFTGSAAYFMAPMFLEPVVVLASMDASPKNRIELRDQSQPALRGMAPIESIASDIVYSWTSLPYDNHFLVITVDPVVRLTVFDRLVVTVQEPVPNSATPISSSTNVIVTSSQQPAAPSATPSIGTTNAPQSSTVSTRIVVGASIAAVVAIALLSYIAYQCYRRRRNRQRNGLLSAQPNKLFDPNAGNFDRNPPFTDDVETPTLQEGSSVMALLYPQTIASRNASLSTTTCAQPIRREEEGGKSGVTTSKGDALDPASTGDGLIELSWNAWEQGSTAPPPYSMSQADRSSSTP